MAVDLAEKVRKILEEYSDDVDKAVDKAIRAVARKGVQELKSASSGSFGGTGKYASGWRSKMTGGRLNPTATLYNATMPGLPHLLEHGHAKRGGGRVAGRVHIAPVEQDLIDFVEREIKGAL